MQSYGANILLLKSVTVGERFAVMPNVNLVNTLLTINYILEITFRNSVYEIGPICLSHYVYFLITSLVILFIVSFQSSACTAHFHCVKYVNKI